MGDDDHGLALLGKVQHNIQHLAHHFRIKGSGHFVKQKDLRVHTQCAHDGNALLLSAGKLTRVAVFLGKQAHTVQQSFGLLLHFRFGALLHLGGCQKHIVQHRHVREQLVALEHHADALAQLSQIFTAVGNGLIAQPHPAALGGLQTIQTAQQGAFAAARRADHHDDLAGLDSKADIIQHGGLAIGLDQMFNSQNRFCHVRSLPFLFEIGCQQTDGPAYEEI